MSGMADEMMRRVREEGIDPRETPEDALGGGTSASGTGGNDPAPAPEPQPSRDVNTDTRGREGDPGPIPYSRFAEVNTQLKELRDRYSVLDEYGIEPDSAVRLANFEAAYGADPTGTIALMVDQLDLPDSRKEALKELLSVQATKAVDGAGQDPDGGSDGNGTQLPSEVKEAVQFVQDLRKERADAESAQRLEHVVSAWKQHDAEDGVEIPARTRLMYIQTAAAQGGFTSLEELAERARTAFHEDRDTMLGGAVSQRRETGRGPLPVSGTGVPPTLPMVPKTMAEARKLINADIAQGRFSDLTGG